MFLGTLLVASVAFATTYIYVGRGVGTARIGSNDHWAASQLSGTHKYVRDTRYSYTVFHWYVGRRMANGKYPIELYSKSDHRVYRFQVNSGSYPTAKGIRVGSSVTAMRNAYPTAKGPSVSGQYVRYTMTHSVYSFRTYTDFYCRGGKVAYVIVRR